MAAFTSYAQNFEDVILWRALGHIRNGHYIDIGAQSPLIDSVSKGFYDKGWRGLHVEPTSKYCNELKQARPDELVIEAAVGAEPGRLTFFEVSGTGLSTARPDIAQQHVANGFEVVERVVPMITLDNVFEAFRGQAIHWLKVDVEGSEREVLEGWKTAPARPWVLVIESTLPMSQIDSYSEWESFVMGKGYRFVYFDGLNRFYLAEGHDDLLPAFRSGPNVFDGFMLSGTATSPFCASVNQQIAFLQTELDAEVEREREAAAQNLDNQRKAFAAQLEAVSQQLDSERRGSAVRLEAFASRLRRYSARLEESEARVRALNDVHRVQIDRFQAHAQWLENEWALAKARNDEFSAAVTEWRVECKRLSRELLDLRSSTSWKLTAPLRAVRRAIEWICSFVLLRGWRLFARGLKTGFRHLFVRGMRMASRHSGVKRSGRALLKRLPWLERRVRRLATQTGLLTSGSRTMATDSRTATQPQLHDDQHPLPDSAERILADLTARMGEARR